MRVVNNAHGESVVTVIWHVGKMRQPFDFLCRWLPFIGVPLVDYSLTRMRGVVCDEWIELRPVGNVHA